MAIRANSRHVWLLDSQEWPANVWGFSIPMNLYDINTFLLLLGAAFGLVWLITAILIALGEVGIL